MGQNGVIGVNEMQTSKQDELDDQTSYRCIVAAHRRGEIAIDVDARSLGHPHCPLPARAYSTRAFTPSSSWLACRSGFSVIKSRLASRPQRSCFTGPSAVVSCIAKCVSSYANRSRGISSCGRRCGVSAPSPSLGNLPPVWCNVARQSRVGVRLPGTANAPEGRHGGPGAPTEAFCQGPAPWQRRHPPSSDPSDRRAAAAANRSRIRPEHRADIITAPGPLPRSSHAWRDDQSRDKR